MIWLRQYPTQDGLGYFCGISQATMRPYIQRVLPILERSGQAEMRLPDPSRKRRRSLDVLLKDLPELMVVLDSFEQKIQRSKAINVRDD